MRSDLGTGTGKSLAFTLPIVGCLQSSLNSLKGRYPCCLVLEPTRELAKQLINDFLYIKSRLLSISMFYGRKNCPRQEQSLQRGSNVPVVTSVRLKDFIRQEKLIVPRCEMFALDEFDRMLDMGFQINRCYSRLSSMKVPFDFTGRYRFYYKRFFQGQRSIPNDCFRCDDSAMDKEKCAWLHVSE